MSLSINNVNNSSMVHTLSHHRKKMQNTMRRISSGEKNNRASDNPAGLAIRELMRSRISAMEQGNRNVQDASSMMQVADGAMQTINNQLSRMKELAMQASNGIYSPEQRNIINREYQQVAEEVTRIANTTEFNGIKLLDGSAKDLAIHFGDGNTGNVDNYPVNIDSVTAQALGLDAKSPAGDISTQGNAQNALEAIDNAIENVDAVRGSIGAVQNRLDATSENISVQTVNLRASESRISDADIVREMVNFMQEKAMLEGATAMYSYSLLTNSLVDKKV